MIARVAESCFWMHRYMERAENTARLLRVNRAFVLDNALPGRERWWPVIVVAGEQHRFSERFPEGEEDAELVQRYLVWDRDNPVSIASSVTWARENARTIREVISREMWEVINDLWQWLGSAAARRSYHRDRDAFYRNLLEVNATFQGVGATTVLRDEPFEFMQLGTLLERAGQTARIVDVKHHAIGPTDLSTEDTYLESAQWTALLRSCSAIEPFFKSTRGVPSGRAVLGFLLLDERFPRSVAYCLSRAADCLGQIRRRAERPVGRADDQLAGLLAGLRSRTPARLFQRDAHEELTWIIDRTAEVCSAVDADYFAASFATPAFAARVES